MREYDLVIIGGGCAGLSSAFFSKYYDKEKLNVLLIEKLNEEKYEKYHKMCGCVVNKKLFDEIKPIKLKIIGKIRRQIEVFPNNIEVETKVDGLIIDRVNSFNKIKEQFLNFGGEFLNSSLIEFKMKGKREDIKKCSSLKNVFHQKDEIKRDNYFNQKKYVKIKLSNGSFIKTKYLIDCSGSNSLIRKKLGIKAKTKTLFQYLIDKKPMKETIVFEYDEKYKGSYKWNFPFENFTKIGSPFNFKIKEKVLERHVRTVSFGGLKKYVYGNILLCGESACQTNALTRGGIRIAMVSGKLSAFAVLKDSPQFYEREFKKTIFANEIFLNAFNIFKKMNNKQLTEFIENFRKNAYEQFPIEKSLKDKKYSELSKAFILSQEFGW